MLTMKEKLETGVTEKYDRFGNVVYRENSLGFKVWNQYDNKNRLIHVKTSTGYEIKFKYDKFGNITSRYEEGPDYIRCSEYAKPVKGVY